MTFSLALVAGYIVLMAGVAEVADRGSPPYSLAGLVGLAAVHFAVGALSGRLWTLALPLVAIAVAVPFGDPDSPSDAEVPVWVGLAFRLPLLVGAVLAGVAARRLASGPRRPARH
jgi:hypothetical protein